MKTARERFEEAGYKIAYEDSRILHYENRVLHISVVFKLYKKAYVVISIGDFIDMETHNLITYQLEELGWL